MPPLITIGIPVYNGMPWISETIESVRRQTFTGFEVLVIDDGSTDCTPDYLRSIADPRFRIVRQENRGITATLNRMLAEVNSPWLMRLDTDDVAFPQRLARTVEYTTRFPDTGIFYSHAVHYQNHRRLGRLRTSEGSPGDLRQLVKSGYLPAICHSTAVLNVAKARQIGGYRFDFNVEEYDLYWRMALAHDVRFIPETLVGYRINTGSISGKDMRIQALNVLYVQYLLLSAVWDAVPQSYEDVRPCLEGMVDGKTLGYRIHLRAAMMALANRRYGSTITSALRALGSSPRLFWNRILYCLEQPQLVVVGEHPEMFASHFSELWPNGTSQMITNLTASASVESPLRSSSPVPLPRKV